MTGRCSTCRWWRREHYDEFGSRLDAEYVRDYDLTLRDPGTFDPVPPPFPIGRCAQPLLVQFERPLAANGAVVLDGSHYAAALATGADFGCVNHAETPTPPPLARPMP